MASHSSQVNPYQTSMYPGASSWTQVPLRDLSSSGFTLSQPLPVSCNSERLISPRDNLSSSEPQPHIPPKVDIDQNPVVYIDLPEASCSEVSQSIRSPEEIEPEYVQDTILFDPFENRRINVPKEVTQTQQAFAPDPSTDGQSSPHCSTAVRPNTLELMCPSSSSVGSPCTSTPGQVFCVQDPDIPVSRFPDPPPAYSEIDITPTAQGTPPIPRCPTLEQPRHATTISPEIQANHSSPGSCLPLDRWIHIRNRKFLICHHCGSRVHTLVVKENGFITYLVISFLFIVCFPLCLIVYFSGWMQHTNHYCPVCNQLIGYQLPFGGKKIHFVS